MIDHLQCPFPGFDEIRLQAVVCRIFVAICLLPRAVMSLPNCSGFLLGEEEVASGMGCSLTHSFRTRKPSRCQEYQGEPFLLGLCSLYSQKSCCLCWALSSDPCKETSFCRRDGQCFTHPLCRVTFLEPRHQSMQGWSCCWCSPDSKLYKVCITTPEERIMNF